MRERGKGRAESGVTEVGLFMTAHIFRKVYQNSQNVDGSEFLMKTHERLSSWKTLMKEEQKQRAQKYEIKTEMTMIL